MTELEKKIVDAAQKYYTDGTSDLTDEEFDALVDQLKTENPDSELFTVGWGYNIENDTTAGNKYPHKYGRAGSLSKCRTWAEIPDRFKFKLIDVSLKLDGLSVVMYYKNGEMYQALTRGDGEVGIDITDKIKLIAPTKLNVSSFTGALRGEILMSFDNFEEFKEYHPSAKNPRNSAAGLINGKDTLDDIKKYLEVVVYSVVGCETPADIYTVESWRKYLYTLAFTTGLQIVDNKMCCMLNEKSMDELYHLRSDWYNKFPADGLVFTTSINILDDYIEPNSVAFKFPPEAKRTIVEGVEWNMSKTRYAVPKVRINPVTLAGTTVSYCTGFNAKYILDNKIGAGAVVTVAKHGEIIPNIDSVDTPASDADMITTCPDCGEPLEWSGVHLVCKNLSCSNAQEQDLCVWIDHLAPIDGLGEKIRNKYLRMIRPELSVESVMEGYHFQRTTSGIGGHEKLFYEMYNKLHGFVSDPSIKLVDALLALNIPRLGDITAQKLAQYPDMVKKLLDCHDDLKFVMHQYELSQLIGQANAESIIKNRFKLQRLRYIQDRIVWEVAKPAEAKGKVAITGKLSVKRAVFEDELRAAGYTPGEISKDSVFLITDDPNSSSSKNKKADQWGITKITEADFRANYLNK